MPLLDQHDKNVERGPYYERDSDSATAASTNPVRLIAYYLPQFHPFPENDTWWGKGFTEWTNVTKALPRFVGHYQPHLPGEFGFYDLRLPEVLRAQAALARRKGIYGFCFHYYWFQGKKLLDTPLKNLLADPNIDLPFCVNWANENWTRTWSGDDKRVLIQQNYSPDDDLAFADEVALLFRDPRYIRINGRPVLMLYRPGILPNAAETVARWREHFKERWGEDVYLVTAFAFDEGDPRTWGMDAAAGFPPHNCGWTLPDISDTLKVLDERHRGRVRLYEEMAKVSLAQRPDFLLFPGVCPGWDNDARRPARGATFVGNTPAGYGNWLRGACAQALSAPSVDERIVFVNAWNEWGEGAHLEPDRHFGYAFLNETARVLQSVAAWTRSAVQAPDGAVAPSAVLPLTAPRSTAPSQTRVWKFRAANVLDRIARRLRQ